MCGDEQRRRVRHRTARQCNHSTENPVAGRVRLLDSTQQQPREKQRHRNIARVLLGLCREIDERAAECECRHGHRLAELIQQTAHHRNKYDERCQACGERNRAQPQFAAANADDDFLREQESDGCALRVVERLCQLQEGAVKNVARESDFVHPQRTVGESTGSRAAARLPRPLRPSGTARISPFACEGLRYRILV